MTTPSLLDAIRVVKENERKSMASYADAINKTGNPLGKKLFEQLSLFEKYHLEMVTRLEKSLEETGEYINYEGKEFPLPPILEVKAAVEPNQKSVISLITAAMEFEKTTEKAYADLATQVSDPQGHKMFSRLADEEHNHYRILREAYWAISNQGVWQWSPQ